MLDYDAEVARYDRTRGGEARAIAAAAAIETLLPGGAERILDLGGGTGIVSRHLSGPHRTVLVADASMGMLRAAAGRLPCRLLHADATTLPLRANGLDAVTCVWVLHLLDPATVASVIGEVARVLRPGGRFITTVDKNAGHQDRADVFAVMKPLRQSTSRSTEAPDATAAVSSVAARHGLEPVGETGFPGTGQGMPPAQIHDLLGRWFPTAPAELVLWTQTGLRALPDQDAPPLDPVYRLRAFEKVESGSDSA